MLAPVERALAGRSWLLPEFSAADIMLGYSVKLASLLRLLDEATPEPDGLSRALRGAARLPASRRMSRPARVDACLVAGGKYHDIDFARLELLKLLAEHPQVRVTRARSDYGDLEAIARSRFLVTYTCDVRPERSRAGARSRASCARAGAGSRCTAPTRRSTSRPRAWRRRAASRRSRTCSAASSWRTRRSSRTA